MANKWKFPQWLEDEVRKRDKVCVYCGKSFEVTESSKKLAPSWEHIVNDAKIITRNNIALCCRGCNASKGQKTVSEWLQSKYCKDRGIGQHTVATVLKQAIEKGL
jgi:hypothetical protein